MDVSRDPLTQGDLDDVHNLLECVVNLLYLIKLEREHPDTVLRYAEMGEQCVQDLNRIIR